MVRQPNLEGIMSALKITNGLKRDLERFYRLAQPICNADVTAEYRMLARKGSALIVGDVRLEALRNIFARHGADPVHG